MHVIPCHLSDPDLQEGRGIPEVQYLPERASHSFMLVKHQHVFLEWRVKYTAYSVKRVQTSSYCWVKPQCAALQAWCWCWLCFAAGSRFGLVVSSSWKLSISRGCCSFTSHRKAELSQRLYINDNNIKLKEKYIKHYRFLCFSQCWKSQRCIYFIKNTVKTVKYCITTNSSCFLCEYTVKLIFFSSLRFIYFYTETVDEKRLTGAASFPGSPCKRTTSALIQHMCLFVHFLSSETC